MFIHDIFYSYRNWRNISCKGYKVIMKTGISYKCYRKFPDQEWLQDNPAFIPTFPCLLSPCSALYWFAVLLQRLFHPNKGAFWWNLNCQYSTWQSVFPIRIGWTEIDYISIATLLWKVYKAVAMLYF